MSLGEKYVKKFKFKAENKKSKNNFNSRTYDYYFNQYYIEYVCKKILKI